MGYKIKVTEGALRSIVKKALNEISDELKARAYVKANVDGDELSASHEPLAKNGNGSNVHRATQKKRRERQKQTFKNGLSDSLSKKLGRFVSVSRGGDGDVSYYGDFGRKGVGDTTFHHYAYANGEEPVSVYHDRGSRGIDSSDVKASEEISDLVDAMAGYHDHLTHGRDFKQRLSDINDRANDVEAVNRYKEDMKDYEDAMWKNKMDIEAFERMPWYKKIGKKAPTKMTREKPHHPTIKTGPYFMPDDPSGLYKKADRLKATRDKNNNAYEMRLKKKHND